LTRAHLLYDGQPEAVIGGVVVARAAAVTFDERHGTELLQATAGRLQVLASAVGAGARVLYTRVSCDVRFTQAYHDKTVSRPHWLPITRTFGYLLSLTVHGHRLCGHFAHGAP
jgi:hypothetical protein